jgi:hypothetical protein
MQGECNTALSQQQLGDTFVNAGRCVIDVAGDFLLAQGNDLVISGLHVRLLRLPSGPPEVTILTVSSGRVWVLNSYFVGDWAPLGGANSRGIEVFNDRALYGRGKRLSLSAPIHLFHECDSGLHLKGGVADAVACVECNLPQTYRPIQLSVGLY